MDDGDAKGVAGRYTVGGEVWDAVRDGMGVEVWREGNRIETRGGGGGGEPRCWDARNPREAVGG